MTRIQRMAIAGILGMLFWLGWRARPVGIQYARVTAVSPGSPPVAHVAVSYAAGARPVSTIVHVQSADCTGSATIAGITMYVDIPLIGIPSSPLVVDTTAIYRSFGRTLIVEQRFE